MADTKQAVGSIGWVDLTVPDADRVRDFYAQVTGWKPEPVDMGGYSDYTMTQPESGEGTAGVCWQRGGNADLPAQWLIYVIVADLDASMASCRELGGEVISGPKTMGAARYCVIRDPAGAVSALYQP